MNRDKSRDDKFFDCGADHEINYVSSLYTNSDAIKEFLKLNCANGTIKYMKHKDLYKLIEEKLGYTPS